MCIRDRVIGAPAPRDVGNVSRTHRACKPKFVVLSHNVVEVVLGREVDVLVVHLPGEVAAEAVESRLHYCATHPRHLVDARKAVAPAKYCQASQHLQQLKTCCGGGSIQHESRVRKITFAASSSKCIKCHCTFVMNSAHSARDMFYGIRP